ncbi:MAG: cation:proton antiporter subunit C [Pseudomonadota bacterium]
MLEFILARYNYWIVIVLMMTGLYIVFSRGNLVKTLIGLNLFQTSVFIFYITVGKVLGGTAPILIEDKKDKDHHGDAEKSAHGAGDGHGGAHHGDDHATSASEAPTGMINETTGAHIASPTDVLAVAETLAAQTVDGEYRPITTSEEVAGHLEMPALDAQAILEAGDHGSGAAGHSASVAGADVAEILYSNPLPHVLILTAIVVGVATTSVGLSIAVRIREAYGTVEQDALEAMDNADDTAELAS